MNMIRTVTVVFANMISCANTAAVTGASISICLYLALYPFLTYHVKNEEKNQNKKYQT